MTACPHGMPSPGSCWECMEDGNLPAPPAPEPVEVAGDPFLAKFDGECTGCNTAIHVKQTIVRMSDGTYRHHYSGCWS